MFQSSFLLQNRLHELSRIAILEIKKQQKTNIITNTNMKQSPEVEQH